MAAYSLDLLLRRWARDQLSSEQAIGQLLQILHDLEARVKRIEQALSLTSAPPADPLPPAPLPKDPLPKPPDAA